MIFYIRIYIKIIKVTNDKIFHIIEYNNLSTYHIINYLLY
jgi:hypothetical protein